MCLHWESGSSEPRCTRKPLANILQISLENVWRLYSWTFTAQWGPDLQEVLAIAIQLCPWLELLARENWDHAEGRKNFIGKKC